MLNLTLLINVIQIIHFLDDKLFPPSLVISQIYELRTPNVHLL